MKKLKLKLDGVKEMLTREQMKKISGGYDPLGDQYLCTYQNNYTKAGCGSAHTYTTDCWSTDDHGCQDGQDEDCANSDCCNDVDCELA